MDFLQGGRLQKESIKLPHVYISAYYYAIKSAIDFISRNSPKCNDYKFLLCVPANPEDRRLQFNLKCFKAAYEQVKKFRFDNKDKPHANKIE